MYEMLLPAWVGLCSQRLAWLVGSNDQYLNSVFLQGPAPAVLPYSICMHSVFHAETWQPFPNPTARGRTFLSVSHLGSEGNAG